MRAHQKGNLLSRRTRPLSRRVHRSASLPIAGAAGLGAFVARLGRLFAPALEPQLVGELQGDRAANVLGDADALRIRPLLEPLKLVLGDEDVHLAQRHPRQPFTLRWAAPTHSACRSVY